MLSKSPRTVWLLAAAALAFPSAAHAQSDLYQPFPEEHTPEKQAKRFGDQALKNQGDATAVGPLSERQLHEGLPVMAAGRGRVLQGRDKATPLTDATGTIADAQAAQKAAEGVGDRANTPVTRDQTSTRALSPLPFVAAALLAAIAGAALLRRKTV